jgi:small conductance mechanosensitive channel
MERFFTNIVARLLEIFDPETLGDLAAVWLANALVGVLVFMAFYLFWWLAKLVLRPTLRRSHVDETTSAFIETVIHYTILAIGLVTALDAADVDTSTLLASVGVAGLTIGFAARDALSNLISGILIFLDRPFSIGDLIEMEDFYGRVDRITLRSTRIITSDGKMLAVPNTEIINTTVASYTNFPHLRLNIRVTVAVTEDLDRARRILLDLVVGNPDYLDAPPPRVVVTELNDYNVALELQAWLGDVRQHVKKRFELREKVFETLNRHGVEMPYETMRIKHDPLPVNLPGGDQGTPFGSS